MKVPVRLANMPRPIYPEIIPGIPALNAKRIADYTNDLSCWKAMKADCYLEGIEEITQIEVQPPEGTDQ